jgi:hypothetical protein
MRRILAHISTCNERFVQEPMFHYLRDERIDPEQRICFMPMMAHFVFSFMDVNKYLLRNEAIETPFQRLVNIHSYEDAAHWPWWVRDMKTARLDKPCSFTDAMLFAWSEATRRSRMLTYDFIAIAARATPTQLLAIVETVQSTGDAFLSTTAEVYRQIKGSRYVYFGSKHANVESGQHMGTADAVSCVEDIELADDELAATKALVDRLYRSYTDFIGEMYGWVRSHDLDELRAGPLFREQVTGAPSRPLSARELSAHRTPVHAVVAR